VSADVDHGFAEQFDEEFAEEEFGGAEGAGASSAHG
jgi:hypothetical protein